MLRVGCVLPRPPRSRQGHGRPPAKPLPCLRTQGELAAAFVNLPPQALDLSQPSPLSASAVQKTSTVLLPPVNHPSLDRQYNLVRLCAVIAIMAGHQGLRAAGTAEVCSALPATLHAHPHVRVMSVVGKREVIILPGCVRVPGRTRFWRLRLLAASWAHLLQRQLCPCPRPRRRIPRPPSRGPSPPQSRPMSRKIGGLRQFRQFVARAVRAVV